MSLFTQGRKLFGKSNSKMVKHIIPGLTLLAPGLALGLSAPIIPTPQASDQLELHQTNSNQGLTLNDLELELVPLKKKAQTFSRNIKKSLTPNIEPINALEVNELTPECREYLDVAEAPGFGGSDFSKTGVRINNLMDCYYSESLIAARINDLNTQIEEPMMRAWERDVFSWKNITQDQIIYNKKKDPGFVQVFMDSLLTAAEVEAPVNSRTPGYGGESYFYVYPINPKFAEFIGGPRKYEDGALPRDGKKGVWEQEEFGHSNHFKKLFKTLNSNQLDAFTPQKITPLSFGDSPAKAIQKHLIMRIAAEVSASAGYTFLLSHSTGDLQKAIAQPFEDELGHLAKFWAFYRYTFPEANPFQISWQVGKALVNMVKGNSQERTAGAELSSISMGTKLEVVQIAIRIIKRMAEWDAKHGSRDYYDQVIGSVVSKESQDFLKLKPKARLKLLDIALEQLQEESDPLSDDAFVDPIRFHQIMADQLDSI